MINNGNISAIDCRGNGSTYDKILSPRIGFLLLTTSMRFIWAEGLRKRVGGDEGQQRRWWSWGGGYGFCFEVKLVWGGVVEVHPSLCRVVGGVRMD
jgi:hypothetical protein